MSRLACLSSILVCILGLSAARLRADDTPPTTNPAERGPRFERDYERRTFQRAEGELNYGWLTPLAVKAGEKYPLVICLHGAGGNTVASKVLAEPSLRERYTTFVMVPTADPPATWAKTDVIQRKNRPADPPEKLPILLVAIRALMKTEAIDPERIYITGQSMGGVGTWGAVARSPELFAAAVPVCGAWRVEDAPKMVGVPIWAFHGADDTTVPVRFSRELTAAITKAGGQVKYTEYPGVGHNSWSQTYDNPQLWQWLFAQRKAAPAK